MRLFGRKLAMITGAVWQIGRAAAEEFAVEGTLVVAKGAVSMQAKGAVDCVRTGWPIRINSLHRCYCDTKLVRDALGALGTSAEGFTRGVAAAIPIGRLAEPRDITRPLLFSASDAAAYRVGSELVVDGGYIAV